MLVIKLQRTGKKHQPSFRVVVTEKRTAPRGGKFIEILGFVNPLTKEFSLKKERVQYWLSKGAKCTDTVHNLLVREKILEGNKVDVHKKSKKKEEKPREETPPTEQKKETPAEQKPEEKPVDEKEEQKPEEKPVEQVKEQKLEEKPEE